MTTMPIQVRPTTSVGAVAKLMREQDVGSVLVVDDTGVVGVVTDRDLVVRVLADDRGPAMKVGAAATGRPCCVGPQEEVEAVMQMMRANAIRRVPVVENGQAVGIVSLGDLAEARDQESLLKDISEAEPNN
jgi:CBS domain-containing protein